MHITGPGGVSGISFVTGALREMSVGLCRGNFLIYRGSVGVLAPASGSRVGFRTGLLVPKSSKLLANPASKVWQGQCGKEKGRAKCTRMYLRQMPSVSGPSKGGPHTAFMASGAINTNTHVHLCSRGTEPGAPNKFFAYFTNKSVHM
jgi:hypothetical protein